MRMQIRRGSLLGLMLVVATNLAFAADIIPAEEAAQLLKADYPQVQLYQQGDRVTRVYGQPMSTGGGPEEAAELFIVRHAEVFSVDPDELELTGFVNGEDYLQPLMYDRQTGQHKFFMLRYAQQIDGVPVFRSDLRLLVRTKTAIRWSGRGRACVTSANSRRFKCARRYRSIRPRPQSRQKRAGRISPAIR